jgi:hypothetical protein
MKNSFYIFFLAFLSGCLPLQDGKVSLRRCPTSFRYFASKTQSDDPCKASLQCQLRVFSPEIEDGNAEEVISGAKLKLFYFNSSNAIQNDGISELVDGVSDYLRAEAVCSTTAGRSEIVGKTTQTDELVSQAIEAVYQKCGEKQ